MAAAAGTSLVFRSGATSLSSQALTDELLVDTRTHLRSVEVLDGGPGARVRSVNMQLARSRRKPGPSGLARVPTPWVAWMSWSWATTVGHAPSGTSHDGPVW